MISVRVQKVPIPRHIVVSESPRSSKAPGTGVDLERDHYVYIVTAETPREMWREEFTDAKDVDNFLLGIRACAAMVRIDSSIDYTWKEVGRG